LTSRGIDLSSTTGNKVITFLQGSKIDNVGVGVELSSGGTSATSANANFTFGDGDSTDGLESFIIAAAGGFTVNTVGLDPTLGNYDFDDVFFTGSANLATAPGSVTLVSQSGGFIAAGTTGNLSMGVNTISLAAADALTGAQNFAFVGNIDLGATAFTLDSGQTITGFGNSNVVSTGTIQPANVQGNLGATGGNITGDEAVVSGTTNLMQLLGDNAVRHTALDFSSAAGAAFLIDQSAVGFSNASGITIEGVTISNVAAGQTAIQVTGLNGNLSVINNNINVAGSLLNAIGGTGTISVSRGFLPNGGPAGTLTGGGINIANRTGGAVTFTDQVTITGGNGVSISGGSAAAAVNFNGGLDITTSATTGLDFSGLNVLAVANAGSTTINATGQTALSLQGTLGAGGVNFDSITSNGGANGILLNNVTGAVNVAGATSITGTSGFGIDVTSANTGTFTFGAVTVNNVSSAGGGIRVASGTVNVTGLANIDTTSGVGLSQSGGTTSFTGGLTIDTTTGTGIAGAGGTMGITATGGSETVNSTLGQAISLSGVAATIALDSTSSGGGTNNVSLTNVTGTVGLGSGSLTGASGVAFLLGGGDATVSYGGTVTKATFGNIVDISGVTGGTVTLSGNLSATGGFDNGIDVHTNTGGTFNFNGAMTLSTGASPAVSLIANTGAVINFGGGLGITTTSGTGFNATGGGTINVTGGANTISTGSGTALNLSGATIGAGGLNFSSISVNGAATGISLTNVASSGGGAIVLGTVNLQGITATGVDVSGTLGAALSFNDLDIGLNSTTGVAFDLNGATINAAVTANDFDVTNAAAAGTSIGIDLRGATGTGPVRLGDTNVGGASSSIAGVNTGIFLNSATNLAFIYGDGEAVTDKNSTISANVGIDASSAPTLGTYNVQDVDFQSSPGLGFGIGKIYFVGTSATGDGSGKDQSNLATLTTAEAAAVASDIIVLVNDGGAITAAGSNGNDTLILQAGEQLRGFGAGAINLALTVPSTIQLASSNISIIDQTPDGVATLTTTDGSTAIALGSSGNIIDGFTLNGNDAIGANAAIGISGATSNATIRNMTIQAFTAAGIDFGAGATGATTLTNLAIGAGATATGIKFGAASGTVTASNVDFTTGSGLSVTGGNAVFSFDSLSSVTSLAGTSVSITNRTGGSFGFAGTVASSIGASGIVISGATGINAVSFTGTVNHNNGSGTAISIDNGGLASTVSFANLTINTGAANTAFTATNGGTVNVTTGSINAVASQAINLNGIAAGINFTSTSSGGGTNNVGLTNVTGTVDLGGGSLSGASGTSFLVSGGSVSTTYAGNITQANNAAMVNVIGAHTGTLTFNTGTLSATNGTGLQFQNADGTYNFNGTTTLNGGTANINIITGSGGSFTFGTGTSITNSTGTAMNVSASTANVTYSGNITQGGSGAMVNVSGHTGGTLTFQTGTLSATNGTGLQFSNADGTYNFNGTTTLNGGDAGIDITTGSDGAFSFNANTSITNPTGAGLNVDGGAGSITYAGTITKTLAAGKVVSIQNRTAGTIDVSGAIAATGGFDNGILANANTGGTINFSGATKTLTTGVNTAVNLTGNAAGTAINFTGGGLAITTTSGTGFNATGGTLTVTGTGNTISTGAGTALNMDTVAVAAGGMTFASANTTGATTSAVILDTVTGAGTINLGTGALVGGTGATIRIGDGAGGANTGGTAGFAYGGTITSGTGRAVDIQDRAAGAGNITLSGNITHNVGGQIGILLDDNAAGTITFSGASKSITSTTAAGVSLSDNAGATINFTNGGLAITTTSGTGFNATGAGPAATTGGTVTVQGTGNTIASTTGTALNAVNSTIGAGGLTFRSISATGSSGNAGIVLDNTGTSGGLTVTGTGAAGTGGTISNKTGADILNGSTGSGNTTSGTGGTGIFLRNTQNVSLASMQLNDFSNFAVYGKTVTGFTMTGTTISGVNGNNNAGDREESAIRFDNLLGTASITGSNISGGGYGNVAVWNTSGTLNRLTMSGNTFGLINSSIGNDNVDFTVYNSATANVTLDSNTFSGTRSDFFEAIANNNATMDVVATSNTFHNGQTIIPGGGTAISVRSGSGGNTSAATTTFNIANNIDTDGGVNAFDTVGIFVAKGQDLGTMVGKITGNQLVGKTGSNSDGIFVRAAGNGTLTTLIQNNIITGWGNAGIHLQNNDGGATMNASVFGNSVTAPGVASPFSAFFADNGATAGDTSIMNLVLGGTSTAQKNTFTAPGGAAGVSLSNFNASTTFNLSRNGSAGGTAALVVTDDNNPLTPSNINTSGGAGTITLVNTLPVTPP
jgi:hypothetical protein